MPERRARVLVGAAAMAAIIFVLGAIYHQQSHAQVPAQKGTPRVNPHPAAALPGMNLDPTADIHPSVIIEGRVTVGAFTKIDAGTVLTGNITIGHHTLIRCNTVIRGTNIIGNYTHIYDLVNLEGGRPAKVGTSLAEVAERTVIGDDCWINHGAIMHGTQIGDGGAVGLNTACDYGTRIGKGAILANGSATHVGQVIPDNSFAQGVPAEVKRRDLTDKDRQEYFGVLPAGWTHYEAANIEASIRKKLGL